MRLLDHFDCEEPNGSPQAGSVQTWGRGGSSVLPSTASATIIEYHVRFWRVQMSTPHYESAISCYLTGLKD